MFWIKYEPNVSYWCAHWKCNQKLLCVWGAGGGGVGYHTSQHSFYFPSLLFLIYFGGGGNSMHCFGGQKEQLALAILGRGAKDRNTWVRSGVNGFEICLSSCHCNGHSTNRQNVAPHCQGFCTFGSISSTVLNAVAARKVAVGVGQCEGRYCISHFTACLPKEKRGKALVFLFSLASCMSFNLILSYS